MDRDLLGVEDQNVIIDVGEMISGIFAEIFDAIGNAISSLIDALVDPIIEMIENLG